MKIRQFVVATIVGLVLGAATFLPSYVRMREDLTDARNALAAIGPRVLVQSPKEIVYQTVRLETPQTNAPLRPEQALETPEQDPTTEGRLAAPDENPQFTRRRHNEDSDQEDPEVREARRQAFLERMRERADASRTGFVERAALTEEQTERLDNLVFEMNLRTEAIVADWVAYIREIGTFDADFRIRFGHDLSAAMIAAYDDMDEQLPKSWRSVSGDFDLLRLIDPEIMRPIGDLQREMGVRGGFFGGFSGGSGRRGSHPRSETESRSNTPPKDE